MQFLRTGELDGIIFTIARCESCLTTDLRTGTIRRYLDRWVVEHPASIAPEGE